VDGPETGFRAAVALAAGSGVHAVAIFYAGAWALGRYEGAGAAASIRDLPGASERLAGLLCRTRPPGLSTCSSTACGKVVAGQRAPGLSDPGRLGPYSSFKPRRTLTSIERIGPGFWLEA